MNAAHIHLLVNHFPIAGFVFSALILSWGLFKGREEVMKVGLWVILFSGLLAIPTYLSGDPAEDILKSQPSFAEDYVEAHEDAAGFALFFVELTSVIAAVSIFLSCRKRSIPRFLLWGVLALNLFTLTVIGRTNYLGGLISHPEIRSAESKSDNQ